jgi:hypothetical protein
MEQRLDATYLRPGLTERAPALGLGAVGIGTGIFLATWGISFLWKYMPPEIRIANPEVIVTQQAPLKIEQDKPFKVEQDKPFKVEQDKPFVFVPPELAKTDRGATNGVGPEGKTAAGDAIKREVTLFWSVTHGLGEIVTGWKYADGRGGNPVHQYCYYSAPNADHSSRRVDIASNRIPSPNINGGLVPDLEGALAKCQWGRG